jgi:hypothetical protein
MAYQKVSCLANTYGYSEDMKLDSLTGKVINEGRDRAVVGDAMATARVGGLTDNSKERWYSYAASNHMDKDLSDGMYKQLVEAGIHDNGSGGHLADILTLNQRDNVGADMASNSSIPRQ